MNEIIPTSCCIKIKDIARELNIPYGSVFIIIHEMRAGCSITILNLNKHHMNGDTRIDHSQIKYWNNPTCLKENVFFDSEGVVDIEFVP